MITGLVQHPDKIKPGLRVVDIQKAAGEKDDILVGMGLPDFFQLLPEALFGKGRHGSFGRDAQLVQRKARHGIEHAEVLQPGRYVTQQPGHQFAVPKDPVPQGRALFAALLGTGHHVQA